MRVVRAIEAGQIEADAHASRFHLFRKDRLPELRAALADTTPKPRDQGLVLRIPSSALCFN